MSTAAAEIRSTEPMRFTEMVRRAGSAAKRSARLDKQWARAHGISRNRASEHRNGDPNSPVVHVLAEFRRLAADPHTTAIPLLMESWATVMSEQVEKRSNDELHRLHEQLTDSEHDAEAEENRATARLHDDAPADALDHAGDVDMQKAEVHVLRGQVRREIAKRKRERRWFE